MLDLSSPAGTIISETRRYRFAEPVSDEAFAAFADQFPEMDAERDGLYEIVLVTKPSNDTSEINAELIRLVGNWNVALPQRGAVYDSYTAFRLSEDLKGPDCAWASPERRALLKAAGKTYGDVVPEITFEIRSKSDAWKKTTSKCQIWADKGAVTAIAIDPKRHRVEVKGETPPDEILAIAHAIAVFDA